MNHSTITLLAIVGTITFGITTYLNYRFYRRMEDDRKTTIEMFLLKSEIERALKILLVSVLIFGFSGLISIIGSRIGSPFLSGAIMLGLGVFFIAYMVFFVTLYLSTRPQKDFPYLKEKYLERGEVDSGEDEGDSESESENSEESEATQEDEESDEEGD